MRKPSSAAEAKRVTKAGVRRKVIQLSQGRCTYRDSRTGNVCGSRFQVQIDHVRPKALGGDDQQKNLRNALPTTQFIDGGEKSRQRKDRPISK